jgi:hypothetical protein
MQETTDRPSTHSSTEPPASASTRTETSSSRTTTTTASAKSRTPRRPPPPHPRFTPAAGTYTTFESVTITSTTSGAAIYYTTDGSEPSTGSTLYTGPVAVQATQTLNAIAVASGYSNASASALYTISLPAASAPTYSPPAGTYTTIQTVSLSTTTPGAAIYYTLDGSTPTIASTRYTSSLTVGVSETIRALAVATQYLNGASSAAYTINLPQAAAPTFSPGGASFVNPTPVTISSATAGASIYYTTDGSTPTTASTLYTGPVTVPYTLSETLSAIATTLGDSPSSVSSAAYEVLGTGPLMTDIAGNGTFDDTGDGGKATSAALSGPTSMALDSNGNLYLFDQNAIRKVTPAGIISTLPGTRNFVQTVIVDSSNNLIVASGFQVFKITPAGTTTVFAGNGGYGYSGDGGSATDAEIGLPWVWPWIPAAIYTYATENTA